MLTIASSGPFALERKYPNAAKDWKWQYVFPASQLSIDLRSGIKRRHHLDESVLQRVVKAANLEKLNWEGLFVKQEVSGIARKSCGNYPTAKL